MTCNECFEAFSSALDGELNPEDLADMNEHLESCDDCQHLQTRMLALSAELKAQPFPQPSPEEIHAVAMGALAASQSVGWGWLRSWLKLPFENWPLRTILRLFSFGSVISLVLLATISRQLLPAYTGFEAVAKKGLPESQFWLAWSPSQGLLNWVAFVVLFLGCWTAGLPGFLIDLWSGTRLSKRDILRLGVSTLFLGPLIFLPMLAQLEVQTYLMVCCLWAGLCSIVTYLVVAFKTQRPLPQLALDFAGLTVLCGLLEWFARASKNLPAAQKIAVYIELVAGSLSFSSLVQGLGFFALSGLLLSLGLCGLIPSYRSAGGGILAALFLAAGGGAFYYGAESLDPLTMAMPLKAELVGERRAYILGSSKENPWVLSRVDYPELELNIVGSKDRPRAVRFRLAKAYLDWNETQILETLTSWVDKAPGVTWGLAELTDGLGERRQNVIYVPTEARRSTVAHMLKTLRWRILEDAVLSDYSGGLSGQLKGLSGQPLSVPIRLLRVEDQESLTQVARTLSEEQSWAQQISTTDEFLSSPSLSEQRTTISDEFGRFNFSKVPDGEYVLALLLEQPEKLTLNTSIPGLVEIKDGRKVVLDPIRLTAGEEGTDIDLNSEAWQTKGTVSFSVNSELSTAKLEQGASMAGFVDSTIFSGGRARLKILSEGSPSTRGTLVIRLFAKNGRLLEDWNSQLSDTSGLHELELDTGKAEGYLQLLITSDRGQLTIKNIKLESLSGG